MKRTIQIRSNGGELTDAQAYVEKIDYAGTTYAFGYHKESGYWSATELSTGAKASPLYKKLAHLRAEFPHFIEPRWEDLQRSIDRILAREGGPLNKELLP